MALFLRQDDQRSEVQKRVAAELQERLKADKPLEYEKPANNLEQGTQRSKHLAVWVTLAVFFMVALVYIVVASN